MTLSRAFLHDPIWVRNIQYYHRSYNVRLMFNKARDKYLCAEETLGIKTELGQAVKSLHGTEFKAIEYTHDLIAADFRYSNLEKFQQRIKGAFIEKTTWLTYELTDEQYIDRVWCEYFDMKINELFQNFQILPKQILIAAIFANPDRLGIQAEESIIAMINTSANYDVIEYYNIMYLIRPPRNPWSILAPNR